MASEPRDKGDDKEKDPTKDTDWTWLQLPGVFCDTFAVFVDVSGTVRLTFAEFTQKGMLPFFRAAVVLPIADAKSLAKILTAQIAKAEKDEENAVKQAETSSKSEDK